MPAAFGGLCSGASSATVTDLTAASRGRSIDARLAVEALRRYGWPGNVRELENVLQRALVLAQGGVVSATEILIDDVMHQLSDELPNSMAAAFRQTAAQA